MSYDSVKVGQEISATTLLRAAEQRAIALLTDRHEALDRLTALLLERETVDGADVDRILGRTPHAPPTVGVGGRSAAGS